ncbi:aldo/keto reductase [bacterium]|nr:aldo/keto reductase [bacterium]MCI0616868.1 aldo/keto reductase [bacterium]
MDTQTRQSGKATTEGTRRYLERFKGTIPEDHFHEVQGLFISSIGLGTYLGNMDTQSDRNYEEAILKALGNGCNLIDTAINYRFMQSEKNIGNALRKAIAEKVVSRDEIVVATKGGFLAAHPKDYIANGICTAEEIVANCHCMTPQYLQNQLNQSLENLGLETVDIYYIHNPETQLSEISRQEFLKRMLAGFQFLEKEVQAGRIQFYGTATWDGYRKEEGKRGYLSLEELIGLARVAGQGDDHNFRALQFPYNLAMPEAFLLHNQNFGLQRVSVIQAAYNQKMIVLCSASILQGQLAQNLPESIKKFFVQLQTDAQKAMQFVRSTPGVTTALVGMGRPGHVEENLQAAKVSPLPWEKFQDLFE